MINSNDFRVKAGIFRLCNQLDDAQNQDRRAFECYENNITNDANLEYADLEDDYGNTYALQDNFEKAIRHLENALYIRLQKLPPTHIKIRNSNSRLAYLYGIRAMQFGEKAHQKVEGLLDKDGHAKDHDHLRSSSESLLRKLKTITEYESELKNKFFVQLKEDEQKEESERVRTFIAELQEKLFDRWLEDNSSNQ